MHSHSPSLSLQHTHTLAVLLQFQQHHLRFGLITVPCPPAPCTVPLASNQIYGSSVTLASFYFIFFFFFACLVLRFSPSPPLLCSLSLSHYSALHSPFSSSGCCVCFLALFLCCASNRLLANCLDIGIRSATALSLSLLPLSFTARTRTIAVLALSSMLSHALSRDVNDDDLKMLTQQRSNCDVNIDCSFVFVCVFD